MCTYAQPANGQPGYACSGYYRDGGYAVGTGLTVGVTAGLVGRLALGAALDGGHTT